MNTQSVVAIGETNLFLEKILKLRDSRPRDWDTISPAMRFVALEYEAGRREFQRLESLRNEGEASDKDVEILEEAKPKIKATNWLCLKFSSISYERFHAAIEELKELLPAEERFFTKAAKSWFVAAKHLEILKLWAEENGLSLCFDENEKNRETEEKPKAA